MNRCFETVLLFVVLATRLLPAQAQETETYVFSLGDVPYRIEYPAGWVSQSAIGQVILASDAREFEQEGGVLGNGEGSSDVTILWVATGEILFSVNHGMR